MTISGEPYNIPKYLKIVEDIRHDILSGKLKHGEKICSENEIISKYRVSSTTARKSLDILRKDNLIESIQGKGSFVIRSNIYRSLKKITSFSENIKGQALTPSSQLIEKTIFGGYTEYHKKLNLNEDEKILKLQRVKYGSKIPLVISTRYINIKYFPGIENIDLSDSLYEIYKSYNIEIVHSKQLLQLAYLDEYNANLLNLEKNDPVIRIEGTFFTEDFKSIECEEDLWNGTFISFYIESTM